jgi:hypothetical protein
MAHDLRRYSFERLMSVRHCSGIGRPETNPDLAETGNWLIPIEHLGNGPTNFMSSAVELTVTIWTIGLRSEHEIKGTQL